MADLKDTNTGQQIYYELCVIMDLIDAFGYDKQNISLEEAIKIKKEFKSVLDKNNISKKL